MTTPLRCLGSLSVLDRRCFILSALADKGVVAVAAVDDGRGYGFAEDDGVVAGTGVDDQSLYFGGSEVERRSAVAGNGEQTGGFTDGEHVIVGCPGDFQFVFAVTENGGRIADDADLAKFLAGGRLPIEENFSITLDGDAGRRALNAGVCGDVE